jgi:hypothetical protein
MARSKLEDIDMNYYEKLIKEINKSMDRNPKSAMLMNMGNFKVIARGNSLKSLGKKISGKRFETNTVVFQRSNQKASWIL